MALKVHTDSVSAAYTPRTENSSPMNLGVIPGGVRGEGASLIGRANTFGSLEITSNTTKMGDVMLKRGVNTAATLALLEHVGHQNGLIDPSTGLMLFTAKDSVDVTVQPILGQFARDQVKALTPRNSYPVATITEGGVEKIASFNTVTRTLQITDVSSDAAKMARVMIENDVDTHATRALFEHIGPRGDGFQESTGSMGYIQGSGKVIYRPILDEATRDKARVLAPKNSYPVAQVTEGGERKLVFYNTQTREIEKLSVPTMLQADISDYQLEAEVPHLLRSVDKIMYANGVSTPLRSSVIAYLALTGVEGVITDSQSGRFSVSLSNGQTFGTGY